MNAKIMSERTEKEREILFGGARYGIVSFLS